MIHMVMGLSWEHQDEFVFRLINIQMVIYIWTYLQICVYLQCRVHTSFLSLLSERAQSNDTSGAQILIYNTILKKNKNKMEKQLNLAMTRADSAISDIVSTWEC